MKYFYIIFVLLFFSTNLFSQTDWKKWGKAKTDYTLKNTYRHRNYNFDSDNAGNFVVKSFANVYWFFVSDLDGDNCPFRPSCSAFFVEAVRETNIFLGTLMFFDRFTRDTNIFKEGKYPREKSGYYYDPSSLYTLSGKIYYIPVNEIAASE
jgi:putative component of membrane protein insertase Oxa1/YidC/SpoIIIJ protein YidD